MDNVIKATWASPDFERRERLRQSLDGAKSWLRMFNTKHNNPHLRIQHWLEFRELVKMTADGVYTISGHNIKTEAPSLEEAVKLWIDVAETELNGKKNDG